MSPRGRDSPCRAARRVLALYPFPFRLCVEYSLTEDSLTTSLSVENAAKGRCPTPAGCIRDFAGPSPGAPGDYCVLFSAPMKPRFVPEISPKGLFLKSLRRDFP